VQMLNQVIEQIFAAKGFLADFRSRSPHNGFILDEAVGAMEQCVRSICSSARAGRLHTVASELWFGYGKDGLPPLVIPVGGGRSILLKGKIDRLDVAMDGNTAAAFVFDYKTNVKTISWSDIYHGLDVQLPLYLLAVQGNKIGAFGELMPGGAFFFPIQAPLSRTNKDDEQEDDTEAERRACGLFDGDNHHLLDANASGRSSYYNYFVRKKEGDPYGYSSISGALKPDEFQKVLAFVKEKVRRLAGCILDGRIEVHPYRRSGRSPCEYCDFRPLCRFDWQVNEYNFLKAAGKEQVVEESGGANG
jgi:ATP-dependent helicase/nuclease subunit B